MTPSRNLQNWSDHQRLGKSSALIVILCLAFSGCARNLYQQWDAMFVAWTSTDMTNGVWRTKSDVSWVLGGAPSDCQSVTSTPPRMGMWWDPADAGRVLLVLPDGPAAEAQLRVGDRIVRLGPKVISTPEEAKSAGAGLELGVPTTIEFLHAAATEPIKVSLTPRMLELEQCSWHIGVTSDAYSDRVGDNRPVRKSDQRSFRGIFRFVDEWLVRYSGDYQW